MNSLARKFSSITLLCLVFLGFLSSCTKTKPEASSGAKTVTAPKATLSRLNVGSDELDPAFDPAILQYTLKGGETQRTQVTVNAAPSDASMHITVNEAQLPSDFTTQPLALRAGANVISVKIFNAENALMNTYTISIQRAQELADADLSDISLSYGTLTPNFDPNVLSYTASVDASVKILTLSPLAQYPDGASLTINNKAYNIGESSYDFDLVAGANTFKITLTGQSGKSKTYTLVVNKAET